MNSLLSRSKDARVVVRLPNPAASDPTARTLYALLWGLLPIHGAVGILLTTRDRLGMVIFVNSLLVSIPTASLILLRKNLVRSAGVIYLAGIWLTYTFIILLNGGIHHVGLAVYIALPVSAAWLFGYRAALGTAAACLGSATVMALLETIGIGPLHYFQGRPVGIWFLLLECAVMGVVPVSMVLSSLRRALAQSQFAEAELKRTHEENLNRQKLESVGVLASGIAHDFNNLLCGILAEAELVEDEIPSGSPALEDVQRIKALAARASEIVRQLMVYAGRETSDFEAIDLSRLVEEMLELLKVSISKRAILKTELEADIPKIRRQAAQLRQIVMNLIIKASEALGEKDGVITVTTSPVTLDKDSGGVNALQSGDYVRLVVADNGPGISAEQRSKIFDPFFTTKFPGRGLGLAVVQGVVRTHAGAIKLDSTPGHGTTFQIFLPCADETEKGEPIVGGAVVARDMRPASGRVLLIEDEGALRIAVAKMLKKRGFS
jgi:signal transduction histidine kinase